MTHSPNVVSNSENSKQKKTIKYVKKTNFNIANHHKTQIYHNGLKLDLNYSINLEQHWQKETKNDLSSRVTNYAYS
jgi:hypothetical protein